jgi:hypothetical protein
MSLTNILKNCDYQKLQKLIQKDSKIMYENVSLYKHLGSLLNMTIWSDARKCFDLLLDNKIKLCHATTLIAIKKFLINDNYYYFNKLYELPTFDVIEGIEEIISNKIYDTKIRTTKLFMKLLEHPNINDNCINPQIIKKLIINKKTEYIKILFKKFNVDFNSSKYDDVDFFNVALRNSNFDLMKMLVENYKLDITKLKNNLLFTAIEVQKPTYIKYILDNGIDVNSVNNNNMNVLMHAIDRKYNEGYGDIKKIISCMKILIKYGFDIDKNINGLCAIDYAVKYNWLDMLKYLINSGAKFIDNNLFLKFVTNYDKCHHSFNFTNMNNIFNILIDNKCDLLCYNENTSVLLIILDIYYQNQYNSTGMGFIFNKIINVLKKLPIEDRNKYLIDIKFNYKNNSYNNDQDFYKIKHNTMEIIKYKYGMKNKMQIYLKNIKQLLLG